MLINCDLGENLIPDPDPTVMPLIDIANIACGGHTGNGDSIRRTLTLALSHDLKIGAHPSYPDRANFGRVSMSLSTSRLIGSLEKQMDLFMETALAMKSDFKLHHIKPHGALYLDMMRQKPLFEKLVSWISTRPNTYLIVQGGVNDGKVDETYSQIASEYGVELLFEGFADRGYQSNGQLLPRTDPNALLASSDLIAKQAIKFKNDAKFDTVCFHSDHPASVEALKTLGNHKSTDNPPYVF